MPWRLPNTSWNGSTFQNAYDLKADWGPSAMDVRHSMNFVGVYDLPFGRGRSYGGNANKFLDAVSGRLESSQPQPSSIPDFPSPSSAPTTATQTTPLALAAQINTAR